MKKIILILLVAVLFVPVLAQEPIKTTKYVLIEYMETRNFNELLIVFDSLILRKDIKPISDEWRKGWTRQDSLIWDQKESLIKLEILLRALKNCPKVIKEAKKDLANVSPTEVNGMLQVTIDLQKSFLKEFGPISVKKKEFKQKKRNLKKLMRGYRAETLRSLVLMGPPTINLIYKEAFADTLALSERQKIADENLRLFEKLIERRDVIGPKLDSQLIQEWNNFRDSVNTGAIILGDTVELEVLDPKSLEDDVKEKGSLYYKERIEYLEALLLALDGKDPEECKKIKEELGKLKKNFRK